MGFLEVIWNLQWSLWTSYHWFKTFRWPLENLWNFRGRFSDVCKISAFFFIYEASISQSIEYETIIEILFLVISRLWKLKGLPAKRKQLQQLKCVKGKATCNELLLPFFRLNEVDNSEIDKEIKRFYGFSGVVSNRPCFSRFWKTVCRSLNGLFFFKPSCHF